MKAFPSFLVSVVLLVCIAFYAALVAQPALIGVPATVQTIPYALFVSFPLLLLFAGLIAAQFAMHRATLAE